MVQINYLLRLRVNYSYLGHYIDYVRTRVSVDSRSKYIGITIPTAKHVQSVGSFVFIYLFFMQIKMLKIQNATRVPTIKSNGFHALVYVRLEFHVDISCHNKYIYEVFHRNFFIGKQFFFNPIFIRIRFFVLFFEKSEVTV